MLRSMIQAVAKQFGLYVGRLSYKDPERSLRGLLQAQQIDLVLDVGANTGQFALELRKLGYAGEIISFEPQSTAHAELLKSAANDPLWTIAERSAVGAENGVLEFHLAANSVSSSALPMLASHSDAEPGSVYVATEIVPVRRLDDVWTHDGKRRVLLKVDTQGFESQVLDGAPQTLAAASAAILEMSLVPLYEGQVLARNLWDRMTDGGFEVWSLEPGFRQADSGRELQVDGFFFRP